jgi:energy-coupling factor transporter ATP-binding protein EcfA2
MSVLELENVTRSVGRGAREHVVLRDVSLRLDAGELVAVWGVRHSGRSMLLRVAAGIEPTDSGVVRFNGRALSPDSGEMLGKGIAYCRNAASGAEADGVLDELVLSQLARGVSRRPARTCALAALERVGAERCGAHAVHELDGADTARVRIAVALVAAPSLLLIEDPTSGVDLLERDAILALLRSLADEGLAVLMSAGQATALSGADRALSLTKGVLRGSVVPELAPVLPLRARAQN